MYRVNIDTHKAKAEGDIDTKQVMVDTQSRVMLATSETGFPVIC